MYTNDSDQPQELLDTRKLGDLIIERIAVGKADEQAQRLERRYRRGWQQGFAYAIDIVFRDLLDQGVSREQAYKLLATFENEVVAPWRTDLQRDDNPAFSCSQMEALLVQQKPEMND